MDLALPEIRRQLVKFTTLLGEEPYCAELSDHDPNLRKLVRILLEVRSYAWEGAGVNLEE